MKRLVKLVNLVRRLFEGESSESTLEDVFNKTIQEGWSLVHNRTLLTREEEKRLDVMNQKLSGFIQLMAVCADIEENEPKLAKVLTCDL